MCPGGQNCVNYPIILRLEAQVQKLYETISSLMKVKDPESSNLSTAKSPLKFLLAERSLFCPWAV